jgi:hypothetical protein
VSLRSSLGSGCARTASPRAARLLHVPVRWAAQDGGCRKKAQLPYDNRPGITNFVRLRDITDIGTVFINLSGTLTIARKTSTFMPAKLA